MALAADIAVKTAGFSQHVPAEVTAPIYAAVSDLESTFDHKAALQVGEALPPFTLPDATGKPVSSASLLAKGPLLIQFYRGEWCPLCNLQLHHLQQRLPALKARNATLVAISPELPTHAMTLAEKQALEFPVLSDAGNAYARRLGVVWQQPDSVRPAMAKLGHDFKERNGDDSFAIPIPATFLVDKSGIVRNSFIEPNYTKRLEPDTAVEWVEKL